MPTVRRSQVASTSPFAGAAPRVSSTASHVAMVHVDDPRARWSVSASEVIRIVAAADWSGGAPIDVLAALGHAPRARSLRVVIARGERGRELPLLGVGALAVGDVDPTSVLPLPLLLATRTPQVSAIIAAADGSLSLLIEPSAVLFPSDSVAGEELCPSHS